VTLRWRKQLRLLDLVLDQKLVLDGGGVGLVAVESVALTG
jgi:hypothetical protein